jgi:hypothetical protein
MLRLGAQPAKKLEHTNLMRHGGVFGFQKRKHCAVKVMLDAEGNVLAKVLYDGNEHVERQRGDR